MDIFDMVPDNFFSLLSSKNKRIYLASIMEVFAVYETGSILGIDKRLVADDLAIFLERHEQYLYDIEDEEDEESNPQSKKDLANYILRRMEECGWIYVDITNDYIEILNFSDTAIIICEALIKAYPQFEYGEDELPDNYVNPNEYQGYIYQIYSILNQTDIVDYGLVFQLVYSNTKQLIRSIRRLDARMKEYITSVIENTEIKDLMERLITYKNDIYDAVYMKLKVSDNIDRYRLSIVTKLQDMQQDEFVLKSIAQNYNYKADEYGAMNKAVRNIDEVIDAFNAIEEFIAEIDNKNRTYINSTIGKVQFLLSEDDNVVGKINTILKHVKTSHAKGKLDKAMREVERLYNIHIQKVLDSDNSLYVPRGGYKRNYNQVLDDFDLSGFELSDEFLSQLKSKYNEVEILNFMEANMVDGVLQASKIIEYNTDEHTFLMVLYSIILAVEKSYTVFICEEYVNHYMYNMKDFIITKGNE